MKTLNILLIDSHAVVREGIKAILRKRNELVVAGEATLASQGIQMAQSLHPDIVITDVRMPGITGIEAAQTIRKTLPNTRFILLSASYSIISIRQAFEAGITGFVQKDSECDDLLKAIDSVMDDKNFFSLKVRQLIASDMQKVLYSESQVKPWALSSEEVEIVRMLTDGSSINEIAFTMKKSSKTVDAKKRKIMNKLGFESISKLTKYAIHQGITSLDY
jgi:DNA-binding NarL/FixJ family response regulator